MIRNITVLSRLLALLFIVALVAACQPQPKVNELKLADNLSKGPTLAYGKTKRLIHNSLNSTLETQMELETRGIADMVRTEDGREGIDAFLKKRQPEFKGR